MIGEPITRRVRHALVVGEDCTFGSAVTARLRVDGVVVAGDVTMLPADATLDIVVADTTQQTEDVPFRSVAEDDFRALLDGQLYAFVAAVQSAVPRMTSGGAIVAIVPKDYLGSWGGAHVAAAAAACVAMARSMAIELAPRGIRVNSVATGRPGEALDTASERAAVAATVAWLAGPDSGHVTGETILADRGASLRMAQAARR